MNPCGVTVCLIYSNSVQELPSLLWEWAVFTKEATFLFKAFYCYTASNITDMSMHNNVYSQVIAGL